MFLTEQDIKNIFYKLKIKAATFVEHSRKCKRCGRLMIRRKSNYNSGYWWGCGGYPSCDYTEKD